MPQRKPMGANPPPRSLSESESLLRQANSPGLIRGWIDTLQGVGIVALMVAGICGIGWFAYTVLTAVGRSLF